MKKIIFNIFSLKNKKVIGNRLYSSKNTSDSENYNVYFYIGVFNTLSLMILLHYFTAKTTIFFYIVMASIYLIYRIFDLFLIILYIENKITTPSYLPDYIRKYLLKREEYRYFDVETLRLFINEHIKYIIVHSIMLTLSVICYLLFL